MAFLCFLFLPAEVILKIDTNDQFLNYLKWLKQKNPAQTHKYFPAHYFCEFRKYIFMIATKKMKKTQLNNVYKLIYFIL